MGWWSDPPTHHIVFRGFSISPDPTPPLQGPHRRSWRPGPGRGRPLRGTATAAEGGVKGQRGVAGGGVMGARRGTSFRARCPVSTLAPQRGSGPPPAPPHPHPGGSTLTHSMRFGRTNSRCPSCFWGFQAFTHFLTRFTIQIHGGFLSLAGSNLHFHGIPDRNAALDLFPRS